ncbi:MAG: leucyl aminopeptidase [Planctomycetota bacterium]|nr:leucyl aminopeptidase [Planctomycetota bacterium]
MKALLRELRGPARCPVVTLSKGEKLTPRDRTLDATARGFVRRALDEGLFQGELGEVRRLLLPEGDGSSSLALLGLGAAEKLRPETLRCAFGALARQTVRQDTGELVLALNGPGLRRRLRKSGWEVGVRAVVEGWLLGGYVFDACKSAPRRPRRAPRLVLDAAGLRPADRDAAGRGLRVAEAVAGGVNSARDLANTPANELYPQSLATRARRLARDCGLGCRVLGEPEIRREKMGAFLGVARGSSRPPRLIVLEYGARRRKAPTLAFVGKAVTFDSGGISIKPARGMEDMKFDMAGGAAVIGALEALSRLKPRLHVVGIVPATENMISGNATRPGDVLRSACGKTIEVVNTDAEGRLILADALHYARRFRPTAVVDVATLTGACVVALGNRVTAMMANNPRLGRRVLEASESSGERVWELPLFEEYFEAMKSKVADLRNSGGRNAGAITAAAFLAEFTEGLAWAHLDIAGTGWTHHAEGYQPLGATGVGVRLLTDLALSFEKSSP